MAKRNMVAARWHDYYDVMMQSWRFQPRDRAIDALMELSFVHGAMAMLQMLKAHPEYHAELLPQLLADAQAYFDNDASFPTT